MEFEAPMPIVIDGRAGYAVSRSETAPAKQNGFLFASRLLRVLEQRTKATSRAAHRPPGGNRGAAAATADF
jgi:hypothetical protein